MAVLIERAPAKINLTLHVVRRREDGYHDLESLVAFTGAGDMLSLTPARELSLRCEGATAAQAGEGDDNLVLKAARHLQALAPGIKTGAFHLTKNLPVAAGLGGGSSDAAAALRLLARLNQIPLDDARLLEAAIRTGSDAPVCLEKRARVMSRRGEHLGPALRLPPVYIVLVNPGVGVATPRIFARLNLKPGEETGFRAHPSISGDEDFDALATVLRKCRNDLEDAASVEAPAIGHVLAVLSAARGCRLARMTGSGATCFGLFPTRHAASRAARVIRQQHASWWVKTAALR
ncbi:MAG: 4-(cytidine 5'-diphospho)-2-C-methyl-D-erythritol kinase [Alphaproteobacteria bacterium]|nr:4-(cytidine 5'-diphospho)-2-C-methyl-D-erythritol kinase [Alphaproteobacteria bacterium]